MTFQEKPILRLWWSVFGLPLLFFLCCGHLAAVRGQTNYQRLQSFGGLSGSQPYSTLIESTNGILYGTTSSGGSNNRGTVFSVMKDGSDFRVLHSFSTNGGSGTRPVAGVIEGSDGVLYGTTSSRGSNGNHGTVFKLNKNGSGYLTLWHFSGGGDGRIPQAGLIEGNDEMLYGTTYGGGVSDPGTVFKVGKDGSGKSVLHRFEGTADGKFPWARLLEGSDGALYGTTFSGTTGSSLPGTIFKLNKDGGSYGVLHYFDYGDGFYPFGGLIEASDGALYGTTTGGGSAGNYGTVFKLNKNGSGYGVIFSFTGDGTAPRGSLAEGQDGALYGATYEGGIGTNGTVFKLNKDGSGYTVLHRFANNGGDGSSPHAGVLAASDGAVYGTTVVGGETNSGTVFKLFSSTPRIALASISNTEAGALLDLSGGAAGQTYNIQATTNLSIAEGWRVIGSNSAAIDGKFQFLDVSSSNHPMRFYRGAIP